DEVLAAYLPGAGLAPTTVHLDGGAATVDVDGAFAEALPEAGVYPGDVWEALLFTAHSNGAVDSVTFTLDGDCLAFAYATGGDMCAPTALPLDLGRCRCERPSGGHCPPSRPSPSPPQGSSRWPRRRRPTSRTCRRAGTARWSTSPSPATTAATPCATTTLAATTSARTPTRA